MGDPACFLDATCISCGRFLEPEDHRAGICPCGEPIDDGSMPAVTSVSLHGRLKDDLATAMKARDRDRIDALRLVVSALDNAGAVETTPTSSLLPPAVGLGQEAARRELTGREEEQLLRAEADDLLESAQTNVTAGRADEAERLGRMAAVITAYL
jgi:uncharacterized protein YqeY